MCNDRNRKISYHSPDGKIGATQRVPAAAMAKAGEAAGDFYRQHFPGERTNVGAQAGGNECERRD